MREAILSRDAVAAGGGDHLEVNWTLASPAIERNPRPCRWHCQQELQQELQRARREQVAGSYLCLNNFQILALRRSSYPAGGSTHHSTADVAKAEGHGRCCNVAALGERTSPKRAGSCHGQVVLGLGSVAQLKVADRQLMELGGCATKSVSAIRFALSCLVKQGVEGSSCVLPAEG